MMLDEIRVDIVILQYLGKQKTDKKWQNIVICRYLNKGKHTKCERCLSQQ